MRNPLIALLFLIAALIATFALENDPSPALALPIVPYTQPAPLRPAPLQPAPLYPVQPVEERPAPRAPLPAWQPSAAAEQRADLMATIQAVDLSALEATAPVPTPDAASEAPPAPAPISQPVTAADLPGWHPPQADAFHPPMAPAAPIPTPTAEFYVPAPTGGGAFPPVVQPAWAMEKPSPLLDWQQWPAAQQPPSQPSASGPCRIPYYVLPNGQCSGQEGSVP